MSKQVLSVILGGGAGTRLFPLTASRSKPAVPIAGKYRLVDIPISNCLNSGITRMFVLTMYNSASLTGISRTLITSAHSVLHLLIFWQQSKLPTTPHGSRAQRMLSGRACAILHHSTA